MKSTIFRVWIAHGQHSKNLATVLTNLFLSFASFIKTAPDPVHLVFNVFGVCYQAAGIRTECVTFTLTVLLILTMILTSVSCTR